MKVITLQTGDMYVNCYLVCDEQSRAAVVIDPGGSAGKILRCIRENRLDVTHILLTHGHFDHIGAVGAVRGKTGALVCIHEQDAPLLGDPEKNFSAWIGASVTAPQADVLLHDGDTLRCGGMEFKVLHTPGHSEGSVCYMADSILFTGDTLFYMSVGRTDFPGSDGIKLRHSINGVLGRLMQDYTVYPGHGIATTLREEKQSNFFFERA